MVYNYNFFNGLYYEATTDKTNDEEGDNGGTEIKGRIKSGKE